MANKERERANGCMKAITTKDAFLSSMSRQRFKTEVSASQLGMATDIRHGHAAHQCHIEAPSIIPRNADAMRPGIYTGVQQEFVVEPVQRPLVENLLQGNDVCIDVLDYRGGQFPIHQVQHRSFKLSRCRMVVVPRSVEMGFAALLTKAQSLHIEGCYSQVSLPWQSG